MVYYENGTQVGGLVSASFSVVPAIPAGSLPALIALGAELLAVSRKYLRHGLALAAFFAMSGSILPASAQILGSRIDCARRGVDRAAAEAHSLLKV